MPFKVEFATMLEFSTRGKNEKANMSRKICGSIKSGNSKIINRMISHILNLDSKHPIREMFSQKPVLVPAPRSTPLLEGALWPTRVLAEHLLASGLGGSVEPLIKRVNKVPRSSSFSSAQQRPSCNTHYKSIKVSNPIAFVNKIILIDDVFTLGRTSCACVRKLRDVYPDASIYVFAAMRTRGFTEHLENIVKPSYNTMTYYDNSDAIRLPN